MSRNRIFSFWIVLLMGLSSLSVLAPVTEATSSRANHSVSIQGYAFSPSSITIDVGDSVTWTNNDRATHTATSTSGPASFDSGSIYSGGTFTFTFTTAGTYEYKCSPHPSMTASITVLAPNSQPEVSGVSISPDPAVTSDVISASASTSDADGDSVTLSYSWIVNGNVISETGNTHSGFDKSDMIQVEVTPNDGTVDGATVVSNTITISNTPPSITSVAISPSTLNNESIATCIASGWVDDDGDVEGYGYAWTVNGAVHQDTTQSSGPFNVDEVISCTVTPNDGEDSGPAVSSLDVTVDATDAPDADGDGVPDNTDTCPNTEASEVVDMYGCSASQRDGDGDGVSDADDVCPGSPVGATVDNEGCAASQLDSDEDGFADDVDVFPSDAGEHADADEDGIGDNSDDDDDNDGWNDTTEIDCGTNSTDSQSTPLDTDGDGICDILDDDDDDDGWDDTTEEDCSTSSIDSHSTPLDTDGDGICDNLDTNDDNVPEPETVTEPDPVTTDVTNNDIPGFTSVLMFTAIAGALIFLRRRPND